MEMQKERVTSEIMLMHGDVDDDDNGDVVEFKVVDTGETRCEPVISTTNSTRCDQDIHICSQRWKEFGGARACWCCCSWQ